MGRSSVPKIPARLHVILAREAPTALIFRRGPSGKVASIGWNLEKDTFSLGQWLSGRIYEYRCDLSPNGKYLIYFAANWKVGDSAEKRIEELLRKKGFGGFPDNLSDQASWEKYFDKMGKMQEKIRKEYKNEMDKLLASPDYKNSTYTAISKAPYLKAVDLWFNGSAWNGGGLFISNRKVWLNKPLPFRGKHITSFSSGYFSVDDNWMDSSFGDECPGVYLPRLMRDGWTEKCRNDFSFGYEKPLDRGWTLQKIFCCGWSRENPGCGCYYERYRIVHEKSSETVDGNSWRWADYDKKRHRVLFAENGALYQMHVDKNLSAPDLLHDFNDMKFQAIKAPY